MTITYEVWIDRNRDGLKTSDEVITADIVDLKWRLGMHRPYDTMAPPGWAELILNSQSGSYNSASASALMGCCLTILSTQDGITTTHFVGFIDQIVPAAGSYGPRTVILRAQTRDAALAFHIPTELPTPLSEAKAMVRQALVGSGMPYRATAGYTILDSPTGVVGAKLLDTVEDLVGTTGLTTLAYGGVWNDSIANARDYIQHIVECERGRFFCDREGTLMIQNRHFLLQQRYNQGYLLNDMTALEVSSGSNVVNDIEIQVVPRRVGSPAALLWTLPRTLHLAPNEIRQVHLTFRDDVTRLVGALTLSGYSLTAFDETGLTNVTSRVEAWMGDVTLTGAVLYLRHPYVTDVQLTSLQVYGTPLYCDLPQTSRFIDRTSITQYGRRRMSLNLAALSTMEQAEDIARYELSRRKTPRTHATSVTITTQTHPIETLALGLYDRVQVEDTQSLPVSDYVICAEDHHIEWGTGHRVTWLLEPVEDLVFAYVGSLLDNAHVIAY